jgi:hypothetical protein
MIAMAKTAFIKEKTFYQQIGIKFKDEMCPVLYL